MTRYRKKPVEVEAWQVGTEPVPIWIRSAIPLHNSSTDEGILWLIEAYDGYKNGFPEGSYLILKDGRISYASEGFFERNYEVIE